MRSRAGTFVSQRVYRAPITVDGYLYVCFELEQPITVIALHYLFSFFRCFVRPIYVLSVHFFETRFSIKSRLQYGIDNTILYWQCSCFCLFIDFRISVLFSFMLFFSSFALRSFISFHINFDSFFYSLVFSSVFFLCFLNLVYD